MTGIVDKNIVTLVGEPWYISETQKWNDAAYILNKKPILKKVKAVWTLTALGRIGFEPTKLSPQIYSLLLLTTQPPSAGT